MLLVMSNTIFVDIYWRHYFHENLQIIFPEGAVVVAENLQKKRNKNKNTKKKKKNHTCNTLTFHSCKQGTQRGSTTFSLFFLNGPLF